MGSVRRSRRTACDTRHRPGSGWVRCSCRNSWSCRAAESAASRCPEGLAVDPSGPAAAARATARAPPARCRRFHEAPWLARRLYRLGGCRADTDRRSRPGVGAFSSLAADASLAADLVSLRPRRESGSGPPATARLLLRLPPIGVDAWKSLLVSM